MPKFLIEWKKNDLMIPEDPAKNEKINLSLLEMVKNDLKSNKLTDWGVYCNGYTGYMIMEGSQNEIMPELFKYTPHIIFDVKPVCNVDQIIDAVKAVSQKKIK